VLDWGPDPLGEERGIRRSIRQITLATCFNKAKLLNKTIRKAGADPEGGRPPYFWQSRFYFFTLYTMSEKIFLKLNFDFIVAEIRVVFLEEWGCMRV